MWESRNAQVHGERLAELHVNLDTIAGRVREVKEKLRRIERHERLALTRERGMYEPNDEPLSSRELCHP